MHECPDCGQACDCDGDDLWTENEIVVANCCHRCDESDRAWEYDEYHHVEEDDRDNFPFAGDLEEPGR